MGLNNAMDISVSGINAERNHMEMISSNIANIDTTKTSDGGTYKRKIAVYYEKPLSFGTELEKAQRKIEGLSGGVDVKAVDDNTTPMQRVYNPSHPDADENGYVTLPNVSIATEMTDLVYTSKVYEANVNMFNATKKMIQDTLQIQ